MCVSIITISIDKSYLPTCFHCKYIHTVGICISKFFTKRIIPSFFLFCFSANSSACFVFLCFVFLSLALLINYRHIVVYSFFTTSSLVFRCNLTFINRLIFLRLVFWSPRLCVAQCYRRIAYSRYRNQLQYYNRLFLLRIRFDFVHIFLRVFHRQTKANDKSVAREQLISHGWGIVCNRGASRSLLPMRDAEFLQLALIIKISLFFLPLMHSIVLHGSLARLISRSSLRKKNGKEKRKKLRMSLIVVWKHFFFFFVFSVFL